MRLLIKVFFRFALVGKTDNFKSLFESVEQVQLKTFTYIEGYYDRIRFQSGLGYKSPLGFERELKIENQGGEMVFCAETLDHLTAK